MTETKQFPNSSQITHSMYDGEQLELTVYYRTGTYRYVGVPAGIWERMKKADSTGKFVNQEVKPHYQVIKIG